MLEPLPQDGRPGVLEEQRHFPCCHYFFVCSKLFVKWVGLSMLCLLRCSAATPLLVYWRAHSVFINPRDVCIYGGSWSRLLMSCHGHCGGCIPTVIHRSSVPFDHAPFPRRASVALRRLGRSAASPPLALRRYGPATTWS